MDKRNIGDGLGRCYSEVECKKIIANLAKKLVVRGELITTRLLSDEDKDDLRYGRLPLKALELHIRVWRENDMPEYCFRPKSSKNTVNGGLNGVHKHDSMASRYRKPFKAPEVYKD